ncbi:MAG TPA: alpha/beta hydrolase, partial [Gammaproteobacteria bacterium]|nr:alpha/beta hydrolase [Gammaproteobacteria bacterium]
TPGLLPKIDKPVLVIAGSEDDVVPGLPERLAPMADKGDIELVTIDGADHFFRDFFADDMVEAIRAFVEE